MVKITDMSTIIFLLVMMELNRAKTYLPILFALYINDIETCFYKKKA